MYVIKMISKAMCIKGGQVCAEKKWQTFQRLIAFSFFTLICYSERLLMNKMYLFCRRCMHVYLKFSKQGDLIDLLL
jgi:hypothetical protein